MPPIINAESSTSSPPAAGAIATPRGVIDVEIQLLHKHKTFPSAASYNLRCLDSKIRNNGVERDQQLVRHVEDAGGIQATIACLEECKKPSVSAACSLLQAGCSVLNHCLQTRIEVSSAIAQAHGVQIILDGMREAEEKPPQGMDFLALMSQGGYSENIVEQGGIELMVACLKAGQGGGDDEMSNSTLLALSRIAEAFEGKRDEVLPDPFRRQVLADLVIGAFQRHHQQVQLSTIRTGGAEAINMRSILLILLWLAVGDTNGSLVSRMSKASIGNSLLERIAHYEEAPVIIPADLLPSCGSLLFHITEGPFLDHSLQHAASILASGASSTEEAGSKLAVVGAVALCVKGREAIMGSEGVVETLLKLAEGGGETEAYPLIKTSLRTLHRLASNELHGKELLNRGAMDVAIRVLKRSASGESHVPIEVISAATTVVARMTEIMMSGVCDDGDRRGSMGYSETRMEALRLAIAAYTRHPESTLLFRSLVDLAISYMRRSSQDEPSSGYLAVTHSALETLLRLTEAELPKNHQLIYKERIWCEGTIQSATGCLGLAAEVTDDSLRDKICHVLSRVANLASSPADANSRGLSFLLQYSPTAEDLVHVVEAASGPEPDRKFLLSLLRPTLERKASKLDSLELDDEGEYSVSGSEDGAEEQQEVPTVDAPANDVSLGHEEDPELIDAAGRASASDDPDGREGKRVKVTDAHQAAEEVEGSSQLILEEEQEGEKKEEEVVVPVAAMIEEREHQSETLAPPPWVQVLDRQGMVYFLQTDTGMVQWEAPEELIQWWDKKSVVQSDEIICEMGGWVAKIEKTRRMAYYEVQGAELGPRHWRLPNDVPVAMGKEGPELHRDAEEGETTISPISSKYGLHRGDEEEEDTALIPYIQELDSLKEEIETALRSSQGPASLALGGRLAHYSDMTKRIRNRQRKSTAGLAGELEKGLADTLRRTLDIVEDLTDLLSYYKGMYERELQAHERKGTIAALEATMALVKGEILQHTPAELPIMTKVIHMMGNNSNEAARIFKEAHLLIKRAVVQVAGEQKIDSPWTLSPLDLDAIPEMFMGQLNQQLRLLVISYDNLTQKQKESLTTASEIIKNRDWLVSLAVRCAEYEAARVSAVAKRSSPPACANPTTTEYPSSSSASSYRRTGSSPPSSNDPRKAFNDTWHSTHTAGNSLRRERVSYSGEKHKTNDESRKASEVSPGSKLSKTVGTFSSFSSSSTTSPTSTTSASAAAAAATPLSSTMSSTSTPARQPKPRSQPMKFKPKPKVETDSTTIPAFGSITSTACLSTTTTQPSLTRREEVALANSTRLRFDCYASPSSKSIPLPDLPTEPRKPVSRIAPKPSSAGNATTGIMSKLLTMTSKGGGGGGAVGRPKTSPGC